jgi:PhoPQ-activated pathogenicity-related protein
MAIFCTVPKAEKTCIRVQKYCEERSHHTQFIKTSYQMGWVHTSQILPMSLIIMGTADMAV